MYKYGIIILLKKEKRGNKKWEVFLGREANIQQTERTLVCGFSARKF